MVTKFYDDYSLEDTFVLTCSRTFELQDKDVLNVYMVHSCYLWDACHKGRDWDLIDYDSILCLHLRDGSMPPAETFMQGSKEEGFGYVIYRS